MDKIKGSMAAASSLQVTEHTDSTNYDSLNKIYTIWICRENIPNKLQNTMSVYEITNTYSSRDIVPDRESYDLMTTVILRLGDPENDSVEDIFRVLNALFYPRKEESYKVLKEFVDFSEALIQEVEKMSGLGDSIYLEGKKEGMEEGKKEIVITMHDNGTMPREIARLTGIPVENIEAILQSQEVLV